MTARKVIHVYADWTALKGAQFMGRESHPIGCNILAPDTNTPEKV